MFSESKLPYWLIFPSVLTLGVLIVYPLCFSLWMSFFKSELGLSNPPFVWFRNYIAIWTDPAFWLAMKNTLIWVVGSVMGQIILGMGIAVLLNEKIFGRPFFRGAFFFPWVVPVVVVAYMWRWLYNEQYGIINHLLMTWGIVKEPIFFLSSAKMAMFSATLVNIWIGTPFAVVMLLAGLQTIPLVQYEAAKVDGASPLQIFLHITLPHLRRILSIVVLLRTIWVTNNFATMWLLTKGGPSSATETLPIQIYIRAFGARNFGEAAAIAAMMFLLSLLLITIYFKLLKTEGEAK